MKWIKFKKSLTHLLLKFSLLLLISQMDQWIDVVPVMYYHQPERFHNHYHPVQNHLQLMRLMDLLYVVQDNHRMRDVYQEHYHHVHHELVILEQLKK